MKIFALSDPHLSHAVPGKSMAIFGEHWVDHTTKIARAWEERVGDRDLVLVSGDISWAMRLADALPDLYFIARLPGRKVLIKGNHDYWWQSAAKVRAELPEGMTIVQNDACFLDGVAIGGSRLWVDQKIPAFGLPERGPAPPVPQSDRTEKSPPDPQQDEKVFKRELMRLEMSLSRMEPGAALRIAMVHYPPVAADLKPTRASRMLEEASIDHCLFGHLHNLAPAPGNSLLGRGGSVAYHLTSCDYLDFIPALIAEI